MKASSRDGAFGRRIDFHTHVFDPIPIPTPAELERMRRLALSYGIEKTVLLANATGILMDFKASMSLVRDVNDYTLAAMKLMPDFFVGFCYLNPALPVDFIHAELERCIVKGGMKGVKLEAAVKATDRRLDPMMERIVALGVPLVHHTWYKATGEGLNESTPSDLVDLARRFPSAKIVLAHLGGIRQRGILDIKAYPNMWVDTSGSQPEDGLVEYAVRKLGAERILYGSDWPIRDFGVQAGRILGAAISERDRELILGGNARRLLGMGGA